MIKSLIRSFLPWILYFIIVGPSQKQHDIAVCVAAFTSIAFEMPNLKKGFVLSWGTLIFFVFLLITSVIFRNAFITKYEWVLSNGMLALITFFSILIKKPFTIQYAKEEVAQEYWSSPLFIKINYLLSAMWGLSFLVCLSLNIIHITVPAFTGWPYEVSTYVPTIFAAWFTSWFPDWYKTRVMKTRTNQ